MSSSCAEIIYSCALLQQVVGSTVSPSLWQISSTPSSGTTPLKRHPTFFHSSACSAYSMLTDIRTFSPVAPIKLFYLSPTSPSTFCPSLLLLYVHKSLPNFSTKTHCCIYTFGSSGSHLLSAVSFSSAMKRTKKKGVESNKKQKVSLK